jgi:hypothetical protein
MPLPKADIVIGDMVVYRGGFGRDFPKPAKVVGLKVTDWPREKDGQEREAVTPELVEANRVLFSLADGHWCYSEQIELDLTQELWDVIDKPKEELPLYIGHPVFGSVIEELMKED